MKYFILITSLVVFSLVGATQAFAEIPPNGETVSAKTNGMTFKLGDTLQLTIEDYNNGAQKSINTIKSTYPGILSPCGISYFDFVFLRGDHTNISTFDDLVVAKDDALNVAYNMPYNIVSCPLGYFKSIKNVTLESNSHNATITYVNGNGAIEIKNQLIAVRQIDIPFGKESSSFGKYTIVAFSMSGKISKPLLIEVIANSVGVSLDKIVYPIIESPLKQFKSGVPNYKITCKEGLKILIRSGDGPSACVKPDTATELQTRWHKSSDILEHFKNKPEVKTFYAKYDGVIASVKGDHASYSAVNKTDFRARMNLYFDERYTITNIDLYCYVGGRTQYEIPHEHVLYFLEHYTCLTYRSGDPLVDEN